MPITELNAQDLSTVQTSRQPAPVTIASANTIAPPGFFTILTGNVLVKTITPPYNGLHMLCIQFAGAGGWDNTGNINSTGASVASQAVLFVFNPVTQKYTACVN
jgi:hypothetical protein